MRFLHARLFAFALLLLFVVSPARADTFAFVPQENGTIVRFRANAKTGALVLLPGTTQTQIHRPVTLVLSADKRFLYAFPTFDVQKDGFPLDYLGDKAVVRAAKTRPTAVNVFAIEKSGALRHVDTLVVSGPIGQIAPDPKSRFVLALTSGGAFRFDIVRGGPRNKRLRYVKRVDMYSGLSVLNTPGDRSAWYITFSPSGNYLYDFRGTGFIDHSENYLQRYRVSSAGTFSKDGKEWEERDEETKSDLTKPGAVFCFVGKTAFVVGFHEGCAVCPTDAAGRISAKGSRYSLVPTVPKGQYLGHDGIQTLQKHPTLPLVIYRGSFADPYTLWRVVGPGKVKKVGAFASAFPKNGGRLRIDSSGRFLYETSENPSENPSTKMRLAVFALDGSKARAKMSVSPQAFPFLRAYADWVFVTLPH